MITPELPFNEKQRQIAVEKYQLLDTLEEESYDTITGLMSYICDVPISLITLLDKERNFLKSHHGIPFNESPREVSFCGHAINGEDDIMVVEDARKDERFHDNPLVSEHQAIFYAGVPLVDSDGYKLGTLCVYDNKPRTLNEIQLDALKSMAKQVMALFDQRYQNFKLKKLQKRLKTRNDDLKKFASVVSHDLKSPLANIISLTELLEEDNKGKLDEDSLQYLEYLKTSSHSLKDYIDGILAFYRSDSLLEEKSTTISLIALMEELKRLSVTEDAIAFTYTQEDAILDINKAAIMQILMNLVSNGLKYNSELQRTIDIQFSESATHYRFKVKDNGDGIPKESQQDVFDLFSVVGVVDRDGNMGTGIGLATVAKMVKKMGGTIQLHSEEGIGTIFEFSIRKP